MFNIDFISTFRNHPLVYLCLAFAGGVLLSENYHSLLPSIFLLFASALLLIFIRKNYLFIPLLLMVVFFAGLLLQSTRIYQTNQRFKFAELMDEKNVSFDGDIIEINEQEKRVRVRLTKGNVQVGNDQIPMNCLVYIPVPFHGSVGDKLSGWGKFRLIDGKRNPGDFDFKNYYGRQNLFGRIFLDVTSKYNISSDNSFSVNSFFTFIRTWISQTFVIKMGNESGLLTALILGDRSQVDPEVRQTFVDTGVVHILAVSGLHVAYVLIVLMSIVKILRLPWGWDRMAILFGLAFFVVLTGGKPSVVRASIMAGAYILAPIANRPANLWNIIALAAMLILMHNPTALQDLGFLFSFSAVISIVLFYNQFQKILPERLKDTSIESKPLKFFLSLFLVSFSAQIGTLPITAHYFHRIPIIALVANVLIVPLVGVLVAVGFLILFLGWIPGVGFLLGQAAWGITVICQWLASVFSRVPFANFNISQITPGFFLIYFLIVAAIFLFFRPVYRRKGIILLLLAGNCLIWPGSFSSKTMDVIFMDVGQGDAIVIRFPGGKTMLIDAGNANEYRDYGEQVVIPTLQFLGIKRLNWVVMSHPHSDHIGGLNSVIESFPVDTVWDTYLDYDSRTYKHLLEKFTEKGSVIQRIPKGTVNILDYQTYLMVYAPDSALAKRARIINNSSIVFKIIYGETSILFTGDLEKEGDTHLLIYGENLKADILKVAHHGSNTSTTQALLDLVSPNLAVVSVGRNNKFRHPSEIVMQRIIESGADLHRTDESGALWVRVNRKESWVVNWK